MKLLKLYSYDDISKYNYLINRKLVTDTKDNLQEEITVYINIDEIKAIKPNNNKEHPYIQFIIITKDHQQFFSDIPFISKFSDNIIEI